MRLRWALVAGMLAVLLGPAPASAAGPVFSIIPVDQRPYFVYRAAPGSVIHGTVKVTNVSSTAGQVHLNGVDATTGQTSGAVYLASTTSQHAVGTWLSLGSSTLQIAAHRSVIVPFTVSVPASAGPGQHLGGLVASPVVPSQSHSVSHGRNTFHVNINEISIVAVQVDVPGPSNPRLALTSLTASGRPGYQTLLIGIANSGNQLVKGSGTLKLSRSGSSALVVNKSFKLDTLVPQTSIQYPLYISGQRLSPGKYQATVTVAYRLRPPLTRTFALNISTGQVRQTYGTTAPPSLGGSGGGSSTPVWLLVLGGVVLVGLGVGASTFLQRARRRSSSEA